MKMSRSAWGCVALAAGAGLVAMYLPQVRTNRLTRREVPGSREIDEALEDSFPASDPPSFSAPASAQPADPPPV